MSWRQRALGVVVAASLTMVSATAAAQSTAPTPGSGQSATGAHGQDTRSPASRQDDSSKFYKKAAMGNMAEIELGKLGARKAQDPQVKQFAQQMVDAHQRALDNLKEVAAGNVEWPATLDEKHRKKLDQLAELSAEEFDREFMEVMIAAHESIEDHLEDYTGENRRGAGDATAGTSGTGGATGSGSSAGAGSSTGGAGEAAAGTSGVERTGEPRLSGAAYDWASNSLREVRSHLEQAKEIKERLEK